MIRTLLHIFLFLFLCPWYLRAQASVDSTRLSDWLKIARRLATTAPDSALVILDSCQITAQSQPAFLSQAYYLEGVAFKNKGEFAKAETAYQAAIQTGGEAKDSLLVAEGVYGLGSLKRHQGDYPNSLEYLNRSLEIRQRNNAGLSDLARTYNGIGNVWYTIEQNERALYYFRKSLELHQQVPGRESLVASSQVNIGGLYVELAKADSAILYLEPALDFFTSIKHNIGIGAVAINIAEAYLLLEQDALAEEYAELSFKHFDQANDRPRLGMVINTLASIEERKGNLPQAIAYAKESLAIALEVGRPDNMREEYRTLAELEAAAGNWESAYQNHQQYTSLKDSLFNAEINTQLQAEKTRFENFSKDQEIAQLKIVQEAQKRERTWLIGGLILLGALCLAIFLSLYWRQKALQRLREEQATTQALLKEKEALVERLNNTQSHLIQNEKMASLGQFTAGIAHEINNPVNFITANLAALKLDFDEVRQLLNALQKVKQSNQPEEELKNLLELSDQLDNTYLSAEISQLISSIERGAERTRLIVSSLRTFSRNTDERFLPADINEGILSTITLVQGSIPAQIQIKTGLSELPDIICQISRLNQVFLNLINNASQAISGAGTISITTAMQGIDRILITISDDGNGMDTSTQQKIFEPFFTTKKVGQGTGLGLSISYGIINQHQGTIAVESEPGVGSTFSITLPIDPKTEQE
ncbi:MAG: tetratricopeptide repeat protein [Bacteroidota bacterium]